MFIQQIKTFIHRTVKVFFIQQNQFFFHRAVKVRLKNRTVSHQAEPGLWGLSPQTVKIEDPLSPTSAFCQLMVASPTELNPSADHRHLGKVQCQLQQPVAELQVQVCVFE